MKVFLCETIHDAAYQKMKGRAEIINDWDRIGEADALINGALHPEYLVVYPTSLKKAEARTVVER